MKSLIEWLVSSSAGILLGAKSINILKVANEENESSRAAGMETSAVQEELEQPYNMGSEQISAALQQILSSDEKGLIPYNAGNMPSTIKSDCVLGSESLNRMLEDMLAHPCNDFDKLPFIEPAIQL